MLNNAKVITSKFLELKENINKEFLINQNLFGASIANGFTDYSREKNVETLEKGFNELCDLLHELVMEDNT